MYIGIVEDGRAGWEPAAYYWDKVPFGYYDAVLMDFIENRGSASLDELGAAHEAFASGQDTDPDDIEFGAGLLKWSRDTWRHRGHAESTRMTFEID